MTTLAELADRAQLTLNDTAVGTWPQATVEAWVLDAIRDYSQTFPMVRTVSVTHSVTPDPADQFDLPTDLIQVILVEYPAYQDPPVYLQRRRRNHPRFRNHEGYYDVQYTGDATENPQLYSSVDHAQYQTYIVTYTAYHDASLVPGDNITVPEHHEGLLILFVVWQAFKERLSTEEQDPDTALSGQLTTLLAQLVKGQTQAEAEYRRALKRARANVADGGITGPWTVDDHDRIY